MRKLLCVFGALIVSLGAFSKDFKLVSGETVYLQIEPVNKPIVATVVEMFRGDIKKVLSSDLEVINSSEEHSPNIELKKNPELGWETFSLNIENDGQTLVVEGGDEHGMAYGLLEVSRLIGVSPWEWWADVTPKKLEEFVLKGNYSSKQSPSVKYRGIFINDEDWGLMPWSSKTMEPENEKGVIGPKTNEKIFELMLRLRANYYWPAMHECTKPFFLTKGNRDVAEKFGIYIGGSHCEPMASSTAGEWYRRGHGDYDYVNNAENVRNFWKERVEEVAGQEILYTLGIRGVHDGSMNGAKTVEEQKEVLTRVIRDQREMLKKYVNKDLEKVPQVFVPYKEILDVYKSGLEIPEDVTLMWCDDNYGYIKHFPTKDEQARKGGNGIYYHVSYWGRPHDYLWLGTFSPSLLYQQMSKAYDYGIQQIWILNVGDIKPAEYQIELFLDMAWDIDAVRKQGVKEHLRSFLCREFGKEAGNKLLPVMEEHYRLAWIRRPEFMGGTRTEEKIVKTWNIVHEMPWSDKFIEQRLSDYSMIANEVDKIPESIDPSLKDAFFQLAKYPVLASEQMNRKFLLAQKARHGKGDSEKLWKDSDAAYDSIVALTKTYNEGLDNGGKWNGIMSMAPRKLPVFNKAPKECIEAGDAELVASDECILFNAVDAKTGDYTPVYGLGYEGGAVEVSAKNSVAEVEPMVFSFKTKDLAVVNKEDADSVTIEVRLLPTHPVDSETLSFSISFDGGTSVVSEYQTYGRSEEWKENILRGQAVRTFTFPLKEGKKHSITFAALTNGVVLDQIVVR